MSGPAMPVAESENLSPLQQELAPTQPQASPQNVLKDILMPKAANKVNLDAIIDDLSNLYSPEILIVPDHFIMALFNIMEKIPVQVGASIPAGRGYPIVKNVIKVLYDYDLEVLKEAQDIYSALSPGGLVPAVAPSITAGNAPTLGNPTTDSATCAHRMGTK
jgi:hypothetical protein